MISGRLRLELNDLIEYPVRGKLQLKDVDGI
jgi:hypothetical protein